MIKQFVRTFHLTLSLPACLSVCLFGRNIPRKEIMSHSDEEFLLLNSNMLKNWPFLLHFSPIMASCLFVLFHFVVVSFSSACVSFSFVHNDGMFDGCCLSLVDMLLAYLSLSLSVHEKQMWRYAFPTPRATRHTPLEDMWCWPVVADPMPWILAGRKIGGLLS